jgi:hypothetical protein
VAVRMCPHCQTEISAPISVSRSNDIECPKCEARLEVGSGSRTISTLCGLAAGTIAWRLSANSTGYLGGVLPTLYAFLAFGVVSPLVLMFTANLRNAPALPVPIATHGDDHGAHPAGGHGPAQH